MQTTTGMLKKEVRTHNSGLAKVAVSFSADTFVVNQSLVLRINISAENRHLRQAAKRYATADQLQPPPMSKKTPPKPNPKPAPKPAPKPTPKPSEKDRSQKVQIDESKKVGNNKGTGDSLKPPKGK